MSHAQPTVESDHELSASQLDPSHLVIVPSDEQQDLVFRSISAIDPLALEPHGVVSRTIVQRTPAGVRPMIRIKLTRTKTTVVFQVMLHTGQIVYVTIKIEFWRLSSCDAEAVRAAIQRAYFNSLRRKPGSVIVRPGMVSLKVLSKHEPQIRNGHASSTRTESLGGSIIQPASHQSQARSRHWRILGWQGTSRPVPPLPSLSRSPSLPRLAIAYGFPVTSAQGLENSRSPDSPPYLYSPPPGTGVCASPPPEIPAPSGTLVRNIGKAIGRVKEWRGRKRKGREKADKPGTSHRKERIGGDIGGREEGNRSGSGSGSGELTYSESRSSASSYASENSAWENSASEHAAEPSSSAQGPPYRRLFLPEQLERRGTSTTYLQRAHS